MIVIVYAMLIIPQRKRTKAEERMRAELEIGDEVVTIGGIVGIVVSLKEDTLVIESGSDRMRFRILRGAISRNVTAEEKAKEAKASAAANKNAKKK
jgi:preprotein translocase subunit YajC